MAVRVCCPHCRTPCLVAEQHLGMPVQCGRCARTFTTRAEQAEASSVRHLDIAAGTAARSRSDPNREHHFFVQHLAWSHCDQRHELAVLAVAGGRAIPPVSAALAPLLGSALSGTLDAAGILETIAATLREVNAAAVVVVWEGRAYVRQLDDYRVQHHRGGRLLPIGREIHLAAEDRLILSGGGVATQPRLDVPMTRSAAEMVQLLAEHAGSNGVVVVARCY